MYDDVTPQGIRYDEYLTSMYGMNFVLFPVKGKHTADDIKEAAEWLLRRRDITSLRYTWVNVGCADAGSV